MSQPQLFDDLRRDFSWPKSFTLLLLKAVLLNVITLTAVRADVTCLDRMVIEQ